MNASAISIWATIAYLLLTWPALAQGYAGLGTKAEGFAVPSPDTSLAFPADHDAHRVFRVEWWYLTANLKGDDGEEYGVQWTLFRSALSPKAQPGWSDPQIWMGHAALTTSEDQFAEEKFARSGIGQAGVKIQPFSAWIDDWTMDGGAAAGADELSTLDITAGGPGFSYHLRAQADGPVVLQGENGFSVKSFQGQASHYYSQPFYRISGTIAVKGRSISVTGKAWLDREWSSQPLRESQTGWDWFSLHMNTGEKLMAYRFRDQAGDYIASTWINSDGRVEPQPQGALRLQPLKAVQVDGRDIPVRWRLELPQKGLVIETIPLNEKAWMALSFPYWEGPIVFDGTHEGVGYLEMTGYE